MRSQEFQIQEGDCGDYWGVAGGIMDIPTNPKDDNYVYEPGPVLRTSSEHSVAGRHAKISRPRISKRAMEYPRINLLWGYGYSYRQ